VVVLYKSVSGEALPKEINKQSNEAPVYTYIMGWFVGVTMVEWPVKGK
jgi:hypothetical protein